MPYRTGVELAAALTALRPGLPVIVCSGYGEGITDAELRSAGVGALLKKLIDAPVLHAHLERLLAGPAYSG